MGANEMCPTNEQRNNLRLFEEAVQPKPSLLPTSLGQLNEVCE